MVTWNQQANTIAAVPVLAMFKASTPSSDEATYFYVFILEILHEAAKLAYLQSHWKTNEVLLQSVTIQTTDEDLNSNKQDDHTFR
jgi:hypothetical protein